MPRFIPQGAAQRAGPRRAAWHVLLACCLSAAAPAGLFAQGSDSLRTYWVPTRHFNIPFSTEDPRTVEVRLHVSTDGLNYSYAATARPADRRFLFQARGDGCYYFVTQTLDSANQLTPSDVRGVPPAYKVCVDTQRPVIDLRPVPPKDGAPVAIQWTIQDDNFDDVRAEYRSTAGGDWYPLFLPRVAEGTHAWTPAVVGPLEVRMQARDKAKNEAVPRTVTVTPPDRPGMAPPDPGGPGNVMYVNSKTFQLKYDVDDSTKGPSGVATVDIWKMRKGGPWQKCRESGGPDGSATVTVDSAGRWGFRLIPVSGVGLAERNPQRGDPPDVWVEVDDKPPEVRILKVVVGQGPDLGKLTVQWEASDPFLRARPISLFYREKPDGEWQPIKGAQELPNSTMGYTFDPKEQGLPWQFYLKVRAIDEAGNPAENQWRELVKVDLKVPRIKSVEVKVGEAQRQSGGPFPDRQPPLPSQTPALPTSKPAGTPTGFGIGPP
jgi:hypothetical protein